MTSMARNLENQNAAFLPLDAPLIPSEEALLNHINTALNIGALDRAIELLGVNERKRHVSFCCEDGP